MEEKFKYTSKFLLGLYMIEMNYQRWGFSMEAEIYIARHQVVIVNQTLGMHAIYYRFLGPNMR